MLGWSWIATTFFSSLYPTNLMKLLEANEGSEAPKACTMSTAATPQSASPANSSGKNSPHHKKNQGNSSNSNGNQHIASNKLNGINSIFNNNNNAKVDLSNNLKNSNGMITNGFYNSHHIQHQPSSPLKVITDGATPLVSGSTMGGAEEADPHAHLEVTLSDHQDTLLSGINSLRRQGQFCDVTLMIEEHEYPVHRAVLATCSPYFFDFLSCAEQSQEQASFKLKDLSRVGFEYLLDFMYTGRMRVPASDVTVVYTTALTLKMEAAMRACAGFLTQHLTTDNCLGIRRLIKDKEMKEVVDDYIRAHLTDIMASKSFFGLTDLQVEVVGLEEDIISETMERPLFSLVLDWVKNNLNDLKPKLERLTEQVNVLYLNSDNTLRDCADLDDTVLSSDDDMVQDYKIMARRRVSKTHAKVQGQRPAEVNGAQPFHKFNINPEEALSVAEREWTIVATNMTGENTYFAIALLDGHLMAISVHVRSPNFNATDSNSSGSGPNSPLINSSVNGFNGQLASPIIRKASINPLDGMSTPRCAMGAVALGDQLVVCGGYDRGECLSSVEAFSLADNKWTMMTEMNIARGRFSAAELDGYIFVCGGSDGWRELSCVERYDPATKKWKFMASMLKERSSHGMMTLNGKLYCIGGCDGQRSIAECEVYDPSNNKWSRIASLNTARAQTCVCAMNGYLFAIGGTDLWNTLNTVEMYDPDRDEWTIHSQLHIARRGAGVDIVDGMMVVVGGSDGAQSLVSTEMYDPTSDQWTVGPPLTSQRANLSAVTLNNRLFAIGGFSGKKFLNTLEWLDLDVSEWFGQAPRYDVYSGEICVNKHLSNGGGLNERLEQASADESPDNIKDATSKTGYFDFKCVERDGSDSNNSCDKSVLLSAGRDDKEHIALDAS